MAVGLGFDLDVIAEPFSVSTLMGDLFLLGVYKYYIVSVYSWDNVIDLIEIEMVEFDSIL